MVGEAWEAKGRRLVEVAAERYRHRLEQGAKWFDLVIADSEHLSEHLPGLIKRLPKSSAVTIAPSFFSGQGLLFDLPNGILVGVRATTASPEARVKTDLPRGASRPSPTRPASRSPTTLLRDR